MRPHWKRIFLEQIDKLFDSGLYTLTDKIYVGILSKNYDFDEFNLPDKYNILFNYDNMALGELMTLRNLWHFCQNVEPCKIWYIHTKGVSRPPSECIDDWRYYMEEFIINRHNECISALDKHDICGVDWYSPEESQKIWGWRCPKHFSGNFWWANSKYIKTLPPLKTYNRRDAETFIGRRKPKVMCFHKSKIVMYTNRYLPHNY